MLSIDKALDGWVRRWRARVNLPLRVRWAVGGETGPQWDLGDFEQPRVTMTVRDAAALLQVMAGPDPMDSSSLRAEVPDYRAALKDDLKGMRLGLPKEYFIKGMDPGVEAAVRAAVERCRGLGAEIEEISLPHTPYAIATYYVIATAEASANLARFDGVRYGARVEGEDPIDMYGKTRAAGFGTEVKRRIILGTYVLSSGYYDAYYLRAQ